MGAQLCCVTFFDAFATHTQHLNLWLDVDAGPYEALHRMPRGLKEGEPGRAGGQNFRGGITSLGERAITLLEGDTYPCLHASAKRPYTFQLRTCIVSRCPQQCSYRPRMWFSNVLKSITLSLRLVRQALDDCLGVMVSNCNRYIKIERALRG